MIERRINLDGKKNAARTLCGIEQKAFFDKLPLAILICQFDSVTGRSICCALGQ